MVDAGCRDPIGCSRDGYCSCDLGPEPVVPKRPIGFNLRVPPDLHSQLKEAAGASGRSINGEIGDRLKRTFNEDAVLEVLRQEYGREFPLVLTVKRAFGELRDPTPRMIAAAVECAEKTGSGDFVAIWQAMLDATWEMRDG